MATDISLSQIGYSNNKATFKVSGIMTAGLDYPVIQDSGNYTAGQSFPLGVELPEGYVATSVEWTLDGAPVSGPAVTLTAGSHVIEAQLTTESGRKDIATLEITVK